MSAKKESVVISGISGRFPECYNIQQFKDRILAGDFLVTHNDARWPQGLFGLPTGAGKIPGLEDFDASYFGYNDAQADLMDPLDRLIIAQAYQATLDAGIDPESLRGTNTGFFFGSFVDEVQSVLKDEFDAKENIFQYHASRIHEALDLRGPASWVENGCATSLTALIAAVNSIQSGLCDQALVGGVNITLDPVKVNWQMLYQTLSADSICHVFDAKACGYVKGEAAVSVLLQKKSKAKRIYAEILGADINHDGYKTDGLAHPGWRTQRDLMLKAMQRAGINGNDYDYFEAHGTGTQAGDKTELRSIQEAICRDRNRPLTIGSVKSITGHAEGASGMVSIAKIIIAYQSGVLAPNLHYEVPNPIIPALTDGTYFVPTKAIPFKGGICGINNFGIGGGNASIVIRSHGDRELKQDDFDITTPLPRLILAFGRNRELLHETMAQIETGKTTLTRGYCSLLNDICNLSPQRGMRARGYLLLDKDKSVYARTIENVFETGCARRPVCFVFDGLGSQWLGMAKHMMNINLFANSVYLSIKYLTSLEYDGDILRRFILGAKSIELKKKDEPLLVALVVVQMALFQTLSGLGIKPSWIVGYSVGEIVAAYADGVISRQKTLQIALLMEKKLFEMRDTEPGCMIETMIPLEQAKKIVQDSESIDIVSATNFSLITLSGRTRDIEHLVGSLKCANVPFRYVATNNIWLNNRFWKDSCTHAFKKAFRKIIVKPMERSSRFLSDYECAESNALYFVKNLLEPTSFFEKIQKLPLNTFFVELSPSDRLASSIRQSFESKRIVCAQLMKPGCALNEFVLLDTIGRLYSIGESVALNQLYPAVEYPVPRYTDFVSPIFRFDHSKPRLVTKYPDFFIPGSATQSTYKEVIALAGEHVYFSDHAVDGTVLYPATGYLYLAWKAIAQYHYVQDYLSFPVEFKQINISRATRLSAEKGTVLKCTYSHETCKFVIQANNSICTTGYIVPLKNYRFIQPVKDNIKSEKQIITLDKETFYRELHVRGYHFGKTFQNVVKINEESTYSMVKWTDNIITYLDAVLQSSVLKQKLRLLYVPTLIESLKVDPSLIHENLRSCEEEKAQVVDVYLDHRTNLIHAPGVQVMNAGFRPLARKLEDGPGCELVIESCEFIGYDENIGIDARTRDNIQAYIRKCESSDHRLNDQDTQSKTCGLYQLCNTRIEPRTLSVDLDLDQLHSSLTSDRFLRTQLDIVMENINLYTKLNVLEINTSQQLFYPKLIKIVARPLFGFSMSNLVYTMAHSDAESLPQTDRDDSFIQMIQFDLAQSRLPYRELSPQELIFYRDPRISLQCINERIDYDLLIRSMQMALANNGFLLAFLRESVHPIEEKHCGVRPEKFKLEVEKFIKFAEDAGLEYVGKKSDTFTCCSIMFRKVEKKQLEEKIIEISNDNLDWLEVLKAANRDESIDRIWIHSSEPHSGIVGLTRGLAKDIAKNKANYVFFDAKHISLDKALEVARRTQLLQNGFLGDRLGSYRHITFPEELESIDNVEQFELRQTKSGDLSSFQPFVKQPLESLGYDEKAIHDTDLGPHDRVEKLLVDIDKSSLNFRDVMVATARMDASNVCDHMAWDDVVLGFEFAGVLRQNGQRVMGFDNCKGLSVNIVANREFLWPMPADWSFAQAVTVPCVYATCYYGLLVRAKITPGESILIHAGTGGIGMAAINICTALGCNLFVTAGTEAKRDFLAKTYPKLDPKQIGNSRDFSFETMVMQHTNGRGVDLVLNSLTDDMFWASLRCLADSGRFVEIGKYQFMNNDLMDGSHFLRNKTFMGVHLDRLFPGTIHEALMTPKATRERKQLWSLLNDGIRSGVVKPLPYTLFKYDQVESAFRFMSTGKHIGKVVVDFGKHCQQLDRPLKVRAVPRSYFNPRKSYIIAGGLGGMGLELMYWMQDRGARRFVLTSRTGINTPTHAFMIKMTQQCGSQVVVSKHDAGCEQGAKALLREAEAMGPLGGVFLSTLVLANESIDKITVPMYELVMYAKSTQAIMFDRITRRLNYQLDYFVAFSSIAAGRGFPGQTNYAFANSILERVCEQRRKDGLHAVAIQWGMIGDVGYVADNIHMKESIRGYKPQPILSCWAVLDRFMQSGQSVCGSFIRVDTMPDKANGKVSLLDLVCNVMGIKDKNKLDPKSTLADVGLDSMVASEIGNIFENEFHIALTAKDIRAMTIEKISSGLKN